MIQNNLQTESDNTLFRILIPSFELIKSPTHLVARFLKSLKTLVRATNCTCLLTCDEQLMSPEQSKFLQYFADAVWSITSFKDHTSMRIGEYDGTLKLVKSYSLHSLAGWLP